MNLHLNFTNSKVCHPYLMLYSTNTLFGLHKATIKHVLVVPDIIKDVEFHNGTIYIFGKSKVYCFKGNKLDKVLDSFIRENTTSQLLPIQSSKVLFNDWQDLKRPISFAIKFRDYLVVQFEQEVIVFDKNLLSVVSFPFKSYQMHDYMNLLIIHTENGILYLDELFKQRIVFPLSNAPFLLHQDKIYQIQNDKTVVTNLLTKATQYLHFNVNAIGANTMASCHRTLDLYYFDFYKVTLNKSTNLNVPYKRNYNHPVSVSGCGEYVFLCTNDKLLRYHSQSGRIDAEIDIKVDFVISHPMRHFVIAFSNNMLYVMNWKLLDHKLYDSYISDAYFLNNYLVTVGISQITIYNIEDDYELNVIRQYDTKQLCKSDYKITGSSCDGFNIYFTNASTVFKINVITNSLMKMDLNCDSDILQVQYWRNLLIIRHFDGIRMWKLPTKGWTPKLIEKDIKNEKMIVDVHEDVDLSDNDSMDTLSTMSDDSDAFVDLGVEDTFKSQEYIKGLAWGSTLHVWKNVLHWQKIQQRNTEERHVPFFLGDLQQPKDEELRENAGDAIGEQPLVELPDLIEKCTADADYKTNVKNVIELLLNTSAPVVDVALRCLDDEMKLKMIRMCIDAMGFTSRFEYLNAWISVLVEANGLEKLNIKEIGNAGRFIDQMSELEQKVQFTLCSLDKLIK